MAISRVPGHPQLTQPPDLRNSLLTRQLFSIRVSASNEELPSEQRLLVSQLSLRGACAQRGFFSPQGALGWFNRSAMHSRTMSSNGWGHLLCQLTSVIYHLRQRLDIGASGWWKLLNIFFQDGLAETWQTEMFSWAADLKVQSSSIEKYQPDFSDTANAYSSVQKHVALSARSLCSSCSASSAGAFPVLFLTSPL